MLNKKAFSFVELIIVISILLLLAVVSVSINNKLKSKTINSKVVADLSSLENAFSVYKAANKELPLPLWNTNYYSSTWAYRHDNFSNTWTYWVYGKVTEKLLPKSYIDNTPLDPRTNNYYAYWLHRDRQEFEVAWVVSKSDYFVAKLAWNYKAEKWTYNLIREYNWADFVKENSSRLPYNPYEKILVATDNNWNIYKKWDTITTSAWEEKEIYFSDGSMAKLGPNSSLRLTELSFPQSNDLISKVKLALDAWEIWIKATKLFWWWAWANASEFEIVTAWATAAVRWTVFHVENINPTTAYISVVSWKVEVSAWPGVSNIITAGQRYKISWNDVIPDPLPWITEPVFGTPTIDREISPIETPVWEFEELDLKKWLCYFDWLEKLNSETFSGYTQEEWNCNAIELRCNNWKIEQKISPTAWWEDKENKYILANCCFAKELNSKACVSGNKELMQEWYKLYAYAPYNKPVFNWTELKKESFKMYSDSSSVSVLSAQNLDHSYDATSAGSLSWVVINTKKLEWAWYHNFYSHKSEPLKTVGILIDKKSPDNKLKYEFDPHIDLYDENFAIEMRVMLWWMHNNISSSTYFLFLSNLTNFHLKIQNQKIKWIGIPEDTDISSYIDNNFHTIIYKKKDLKAYIYIDNKEVASFDSSLSWSLQYLYIWWFLVSTNFGNLIDYVKIYKN